MPAINPGDKRFVIAADGLKGYETVCLGRIERADWAVIYPSGEVAITNMGNRHRVMQEPSADVPWVSFMGDVE